MIINGIVIIIIIIVYMYIVVTFIVVGALKMMFHYCPCLFNIYHRIIIIVITIITIASSNDYIFIIFCITDIVIIFCTFLAKNYN